jgi:hypothetical protein
MERIANRCIVCGIDIGDKKQYCCETYCPMDVIYSNFDETTDSEEIQTSKFFDAVNRCIVCGVDMGDCNPRQYCRKTYCPQELVSK